MTVFFKVMVFLGLSVVENWTYIYKQIQALKTFNNLLMLRMSLIFDFGFLMSYIAGLLYTISIKHCFVHFKPLNGLIYVQNYEFKE